jgi:uncharacterized protein
MKLVGFADLHGDFGQVATILHHIGTVDVAILAGDLTNFGTPDDVVRGIDLLRPLVPALLAVAGNTDSPAIDAELKKLGVSLDAHSFSIGTVTFFGCSAAPISIGTPYEISEKEIAARCEQGVREAQNSPVRVFVPHASPYGVLDKTWSHVHAGSHALREFIERVQPTLVVCGHIHEARGEAWLGKSLVVNCGEARHGHYALIEITPHGCQAALF